MAKIKRNPTKITKYQRICQNPLCGHRGKVLKFRKSAKYKVICPKCKRKTFVAISKL